MVGVCCFFVFLRSLKNSVQYGNLSKKYKAISAGGAQIYQVPRRQGDAKSSSHRQRLPPHRGRQSQGVRQDGGLQPRHPEENQGAHRGDRCHGQVRVPLLLRFPHAHRVCGQSRGGVHRQNQGRLD